MLIRLASCCSGLAKASFYAEMTRHGLRLLSSRQQLSPQPCLEVEVDGDPDALADLQVSCRLLGLEVVTEEVPARWLADTQQWAITSAKVVVPGIDLELQPWGQWGLRAADVHLAAPVVYKHEDADKQYFVYTRCDWTPTLGVCYDTGHGVQHVRSTEATLLEIVKQFVSVRLSEWELFCAQAAYLTDPKFEALWPHVKKPLWSMPLVLYQEDLPVACAVITKRRRIVR